MMGASKRICRIEACLAKVHGLDLCSQHYQRLKNFGTTELRVTGAVGPKEAAKFLGVSPHQLLAKERNGAITVGRDVAGRRFYLMDQLRRWLDDGTFTSAETKLLMTIGQAATYLNTTEARIRDRERRGLITVRRDSSGKRRYHQDDLDAWLKEGIFAQMASGKPAPDIFAERVELSYEDEQECVRLAQKAVRVLVKKFPDLDWDEAFSDAMGGVALALSRPTNACPWQAHCFNHARWAVIQGWRKRTGVYERGVKARPVPVALDALEEWQADRMFARFYTPDESRVLTRMEIGHLLDQVTTEERVALLFTRAYLFTDHEIAAAMNWSQLDVRNLRDSAISKIREYVDAAKATFQWAQWDQAALEMAG